MPGQASEPRSDTSLTTVLCSGSDCAKDERAAYRALASCLRDADVSVVTSKCLDVCHGPVVVVADDEGRAVVIEKIRSKARRHELAEAIASGRLRQASKTSGVLAKGKRRSKALRKAGRTIGRELVAR
ncbi:MAG: hypothetical protein AAGE98_00545 [Actinomycetota bacterium]